MYYIYKNTHADNMPSYRIMAQDKTFNPVSQEFEREVVSLNRNGTWDSCFIPNDQRIDLYQYRYLDISKTMYDAQKICDEDEALFSRKQ